ncbi:MAG: DUF928 domain-containing protein [Leptolyngbya sp. SIO4C1]|nr:DUF928 domain-containing protein [Leptolyngbya sp. SIO4C1]
MKFASPLLQFARLSLAVGISYSLMANEAAAQIRYRPRRQGIPASRVSGGTRNPLPACIAGDVPLTAVSPLENIGATAAAYPSFHWYMPENTASHVEFWLYEADLDSGTEQPIYQAVFLAGGDAGIATLELPAAAGVPPLQVGQTYRWTVSAYCDLDSAQADMFIDGWVERVELGANLQTQLAAAAEPLAQAEIAAASGLWFETAEILTEALRGRPDSAAVQSEFEALLRSVELDAIATAPLLLP